MNHQHIPLRTEIKPQDMWDLSALFKTEEEWENALKQIPLIAEKLFIFKDRVAENLLDSLKLYEQMEQISEKVGVYASLLTAQDEGDSAAQDKLGRYMMNASAAEARISFLIPEIQAIPESRIKEETEAGPRSGEYTPYLVWLKKLLRLKDFILSEKEERLFALQSESLQTPSTAFSMLTNVDMNFGSIQTSEGERPLSQTTWSAFMLNEDRDVRKNAYMQFYSAFDNHKHTIAALYAGSVNQDIYKARARGYKSSLERALFPDKVSETVYRNLIATVRSHFPVLHRYYALLKKALGVSELRHYDVYMPLTKNVRFITSYDKAVDILREALSPLGSEYTDILCGGLRGGWTDRYENKGKRSGAFSSGAYTGYPYILMNYKEDVIRDVFTLAHEGGHSMHSWYAAHNNPFMHYSYTIFEAEVASTFNEQLLFQYLLTHTEKEEERLYLLCTRASDILATLFRQTMFAEFELITHEAVEGGKPLNAAQCRSIYRKLLEDYFGPEMVFENESDLECLRIPHFYSAFYVYKYATGISAALSLAERVTKGGISERNDYFTFLKSGGSLYPVESLRAAGVDMEKTAPIETAVGIFSKLLDEIEENLIKQ
ncbi:oligoendopeptidase F [Treponema sp. OMZ 840]|uniref:oligoendopeptidase F n=1 Tax=Treponema sp. OMZ 840 TaxID=244313 RepID=UPI003D8C6401